MPADRDDWGVASAAVGAKLLQQCEHVSWIDPEIHHHDVRLSRSRVLKCRRAVACDDRRKPGMFQVFRVHRLLIRDAVDEQDAIGAAGPGEFQGLTTGGSLRVRSSIPSAFRNVNHAVPLTRSVPSTATPFSYRDAWFLLTRDAAWLGGSQPFFRLAGR